MREAERGRRWSALVVDDDESAGILVARWLLSAGAMDVTICTSPAQALDACRRDLPDVVFTDLHMPGLDGLQLSARLLALHGPCTPPIVLMSARPPTEPVALPCVRAVVSKPFSRAEVDTALATCLARAAAPHDPLR